MTWLEVIDSAIKIGLGALIAGFSAWTLSRPQHKAALSKAHAEREFMLLKEVAEKVERFTKSTLRYWVLSADWHRALRADPAAKKSKQLMDAQSHLFDAPNEFTEAEALLLLMGMDDAQSHLRAYGDHVISYRKNVSRTAAPMTDEIISDNRSHILRSHATFFSHLHKAYRGLGL